MGLETTQWLRTFAALAEDLGFVLSTIMAAHNLLLLQLEKHTCGTLAYTEAKHSHT